jgi:hypothetical protein
LVFSVTTVLIRNVISLHGLPDFHKKLLTTWFRLLLKLFH